MLAVNETVYIGHTPGAGGYTIAIPGRITYIGKMYVQLEINLPAPIGPVVAISVPWVFVTPQELRLLLSMAEVSELQ